MTVNFNSNIQISRTNTTIFRGKSTIPSANTNSLERTPDSDTLYTKNKRKKTCISLGIAALAGVGIIAGIREGHIRNAQKTFKEVFMRDTISRKETIDILKRYKEIEKIKDKDEYVKAMFDEAKKNYELENIKELELIYKKDSDKYMTDGALGTASASASVSVKTTNQKKDICNVIHHELRHIKQKYYALNYDTERFINIINSKQTGPLGKYKASKEDLEVIWGIKIDKKNVPEKYQEFAKKVLDNQEHYITPSVDKNAYRNQFVEEDAYNCGNKIESIIKSLKNKLI